MPVDEVVSLLTRRIRTPVAGRQVFEKLHTGPGGGAKRRNLQPGSENVVEMLLLGPIVFAFADDLKAENIAIEPKACPCLK